MADTINASLAEILGEDHVLNGERAQSYCTDWRGRYQGEALAVVMPETAEQVSRVVTLCAAQGVAIVPQGGNTSLCGGSVPVEGKKQIVVNLSRMNRILAVDAENYSMTVQAGCRLADIYARAEQADRLFPLGLTAVASQCEIGGNLSTNAGGVGVLRYGNARDMVLGLQVVLPDGRIWDGLRSLRKDNTGYDLKHLFIGAEGTLGIITAAVIKLFPRPQAQAHACVAMRDPGAAVELLAHLRSRCGDTISAFELISRSSLELVFRHIPGTAEPLPEKFEWIVLVQLADVLPQSLVCALTDALQDFGDGELEYTVTAEAVQAEAWWKLRKNISEAQKREGISVKHDVSVPVSHVPQFIAEAGAALRQEYPGVRIVAFGHLGDGNIHYNVSLPDAAKNKVFIQQHEHDVNQVVYQVVAGQNGSISAEHGLGQLKREEIKYYKSGLELEMMRAIKHTLDPGGLMNPGKVL